MKKQLIAVVSGIAAAVTGCAHGPSGTPRAQVQHNVVPEPRLNELGQPLPKEQGVPADKIEIVEVDVFAGGSFRINEADCAADILSARITELRRSSVKPLFLVHVREHPGAATKDVRAVMDAGVAAGVANFSLASVD